MVKKVVYRFSNLAMVNRTENWLADQASNGWLLCDHDGFKFSFIQKLPAKREYMINPIFDSSRGVHYIFYAAKSAYGISQNKSQLNKKTLDIFEIDTQKKDRGYEKYINARNDYCRRHYLSLTLLFFFISAVLAVTVYIQFRTGRLQWFLCVLETVSLLISLYSALSLGVISYDIRRTKRTSSDKLE